MSAKKLFVILGATGNQGGSVADVFLEDPGWRVRAVTRNASSAKAQALASRGAEVVQADMDKPETLSAAFAGASAVFAVSDFWGLYADPASRSRVKPGQALNVWAGETETQQLKNVIDAAARVPTLERFILSSLSNPTKWSKGKYTHVYHFDSKARATDYVKDTYPELWAKTSVYQAGLFISNYASNPILQPRKNEQGTLQFTSSIDPDAKLPFIAAEQDTGPIVKALLADAPGKNVIGYREWMSINEFVAVVEKATGIKSEAVTLPLEQIDEAAIPAELRAELVDNFAYFGEFGYEGRDDPTLIHPRDLATPPVLDTVESYVRQKNWAQLFG